jgi:long-chain-fatty-acid--CoA ligase ACSBG
MGSIFAGGVAAGIYTTNEAEACFYIADHSESVAVVCENGKQLAKFLGQRKNLPRVKAYVVWDREWARTGAEGAGVYSWAEFMALGDDSKAASEVESRIVAIRPGHCATLIYTSGTTGNPKAVMVTHDNLTWTARAAMEWFGEIRYGDEHSVSYLPLSHIAAQMLDIHAPYICGGCVWFARPDALKGTLGETLRAVRPTLFLGVPRVWEKIEEKMRAMGAAAQGGFLKKALVDWCKSIGLAAYYNRQAGLEAPWGHYLADTLVFSKVKAALGLDRCRHCATGAAPISKETLEYFGSLGIDVFELYGMSECTGPQTVSRAGDNKIGFTGKSMTGTELVIRNPDEGGNGEVCFRGRHVFAGYLKNPQATAEAIDAEGFLHSGDIGRVDADGFLAITGRIKELIITAGGENIPPVIIEDAMKAELGPLGVANVMVIGDKRKFLSMLIAFRSTISPDGTPTSELDPAAVAALAAVGAKAKTPAEARSDPAVKAAIDAAVQAGNKRATSNAQRIAKWFIADREFSVPGKELTETQKIKRKVVAEIYAQQIEQVYAGAGGE